MIESCYIKVERLNMKFEWSESKNNSNIEKHGVDFIDAKEMFINDTCGRSKIQDLTMAK